MRDGVRSWAHAAVRYRWFVGFGVVWLGIVTTVTPALRPVDDLLSEGQQRVAAAVRGTLGAVSTPTNAAAEAIPVAQGFDSTTGSDFDEPIDSTFDFDEGPSFDGFEPSGEEPEPEPEPEREAPAGGDPPTGCTTDSSLPAPVVTTIVGAIGGVQDQVSGATGQPLPADPAGTVGSAAGCAGRDSGNSARGQAPSLSNGIAVGGLTPAELVRILFGW
jgi:hypothetical protein